jgi:hypothetical protein
MPKKKWFIVASVILISWMLLYWFNHEIYLISEDNDITVKLYTHFWPPHGWDDHESIFYKNKLICRDISYIGVINNIEYLLSPDSGLIVYVHARMAGNPDSGKYGIYDTKTGSTKNSQIEAKLIDIKNVKWNENELILSNENEQHILNLKTGELRIEHQYNPDVNNVSHPQEIKRQFIKLRYGF